MARYGAESSASLKTRFIVILVVIYIWVLVTNALMAPQKVPGIVEFGFLVIACYFTWRWIQNIRSKKHMQSLFQSITSLGLEDDINNFINRFSFEGKGANGWTFRNRKVDWDRIDDLERDLVKKGVPLNTREKQRDIFLILRSYIQAKEENLTRESIKKGPQKFAALSGTEFERLLYRLFEAMGYNVEPTGRSGDQGGDLVANKNGERTLVQAKCYRDWSVGNEAVQQVVGAMKYYDCSKTMVVTTSAFTPQAHSLARSNNTELISKDRLSEMLMNYLHESWS